MNKENSRKGNNSSRTVNSHHPSQQSQGYSYRPSIKVGYKVLPSNEVAPQVRRKIQPVYNLSQKNICRKMPEDKTIQVSGKFINSQYIKDHQKQRPAYHKKGVIENRDKYQSGQGVKQQLNNQFTNNNNSRRCSSVASISSSRNKNNLPSYQNTGIKDIMEYHHALPYREHVITDKCTNSTALSRFCKFSDLHEFDFRKRPEFLR